MGKSTKNSLHSTDDTSFVTETKIPPSTIPQHSLVIVSPDIGRALADNNKLTCRARGTCMYPAVRPGDVLTIRSRTAACAEVGEIAVIRADGYLFSHRITGKGERDGRAYIVTRPDRSSRGNDAPTYDENLIGIVTAIMRNGKPVSIRPAGKGPNMSYYNQINMALFESKRKLKLRLIERSKFTDDMGFRHYIIRLWYRLARPAITYMVQVPLNETLGDAVFHRAEPDTFDPEAPFNGRKLRRWLLSLHLNSDRVAGASVHFVRCTAGKWKPRGLNVRRRYSGLGFDALLLRQAEKMIGRSMKDRI